MTRVARFLIVVAAIAAALSYHSLATSSPTAASPIHIFHRPHRAALGIDGGRVPPRTTVFDERVPAVGKLDPRLLDALRQAAADAAREGVVFFIDSGWRSPAYQQRLLDQAISKYGSREAAARWVASPRLSAHVKGEAVDIGRTNAQVWLSERGAQFGLCRVYANEPWHFELRLAARSQGCPPMYADASQDPRLRSQ